MDAIEQLRNILNRPVDQRRNTEQVRLCLRRLNVNPSPDFIAFFTNFEGPFWSTTLGLEMLDLVEEWNNIEKSTLFCREEYLFAREMLVLTELAANEVIVLDSATDRVYRVDFEGGEQALASGSLQEAWASFACFLAAFFNIPDVC